MTREQTLFKTAYGEREAVAIPSGRPMKNEYGYEINKKGQKVLVKTGETDLQAQINSELEDCKIENIMAQAAQGDMTHFRPDGIYADVTQVPNNLVESMQMINRLEQMWETMPTELQEKYNYDVGEFVAASGSDKWLEEMGIIGVETQNPNDTVKEAPTAAPMGEVKEAEA